MEERNNLEETVKNIGYEDGIRFAEKYYNKKTPDFEIQGAAYCKGFILGVQQKTEELRALENDIENSKQK